MEFANVLTRNEMRQIIGGNKCARGCLSLYGGYYEKCLATYGPADDNRPACLDEVRYLNRVCVDRCFQ